MPFNDPSLAVKVRRLEVHDVIVELLRYNSCVLSLPGLDLRLWACIVLEVQLHVDHSLDWKRALLLPICRKLWNILLSVQIRSLCVVLLLPLSSSHLAWLCRSVVATGEVKLWRFALVDDEVLWLQVRSVFLWQRCCVLRLWLCQDVGLDQLWLVLWQGLVRVVWRIYLLLLVVVAKSHFSRQPIRLRLCLLEKWLFRFLCFLCFLRWAYSIVHRIEWLNLFRASTTRNIARFLTRLIKHLFVILPFLFDFDLYKVGISFEHFLRLLELIGI